MSDTCAWCDAPKTMERICPRCGADYAKAEAIKKHGSAKSVTQGQDQYANTTTLVEPAESTAVIPVRDPDSEWQNCLYAVPGMLFGAWLCQVMDIFDSLQRIVFGMPVHEVGHALTAWLTGRNAIPSLWVTRVAPGLRRNRSWADRSLFADERLCMESTKHVQQLSDYCIRMPAGTGGHLCAWAKTGAGMEV